MLSTTKEESERIKTAWNNLVKNSGGKIKFLSKEEADKELAQCVLEIPTFPDYFRAPGNKKHQLE